MPKTTTGQGIVKLIRETDEMAEARLGINLAKSGPYFYKRVSVRGAGGMITNANEA